MAQVLQGEANTLIDRKVPSGILRALAIVTGVQGPVVLFGAKLLNSPAELGPRAFYPSPRAKEEDVRGSPQPPPKASCEFLVLSPETVSRRTCWFNQ